MRSKYFNALFIVEICSAGTKFVVADACKACPVGSYQPLQGQSSCIQCPSNYTTRSSGSVHSGDCYLQGLPLAISLCFLDFLQLISLFARFTSAKFFLLGCRFGRIKVFA